MSKLNGVFLNGMSRKNISLVSKADGSTFTRVYIPSIKGRIAVNNSQVFPVKNFDGTINPNKVNIMIGREGTAKIVNKADGKGGFENVNMSVEVIRQAWLDDIRAYATNH